MHLSEVRYEIAKAFAELLCETNETGELKKDEQRLLYTR